MKPDKIHDALNYIDDKLIEDADTLRRAPHRVRTNHTARILTAVAAICFMLVATLTFARYVSDNITEDGTNIDNSQKFTDTDDTVDKGFDGVDDNTGDYDGAAIDIAFNPDSFGSLIPTPPTERYAFYHKIFPTSTYLFFYSDAHYWPEELLDADIRYDKTSVKAYYYDVNNPDNGIGTVTFPLPDGFDTSYNHAAPVYANGGGGSCECSVVFRFDYGLESIFVEFNNFAWTDDMLAFEYAGVLDEEFVKTALIDAISKLATTTYKGGEK